MRTMAGRVNIDKSNLNFVGLEGQTRFAKSLIENRQLYLQVYPMLSVDLFTDEAIRKLLKIQKDFFEKNGVFPSYQDLKINIQDAIKTSEELSQMQELFERIRTDERLNEGLVSTTEICVKHIKKLKAQELLKKAEQKLSQSYEVDIVENLVDGLRTLEQKASDGAVGIDVIEEEIFSRKQTEKVPTGIAELDLKMKGGLQKGKIGLLIAGTGVGKSTLASIICCNAIFYGKKVLHIFFEDDRADIGAKYYAHILNKPTSVFNEDADRAELSKELYSKDGVREAFKNFKYLKLPNGSLTVEMVCNEIRKVIMGGFFPDMVFIDYLSCIQSSSNKNLATTNEWETFERMAKKLESFASENNIAIWEAQQTNRQGMKESTANDRIANIQGSFRITQPASVILYLSRIGCGENKANLYLDKCRYGELGEWKNISMDNGTCQIDLSQAIPTDKELEVVIDEWNED